MSDAEALRLQANEFFRNQKFDLAVQLYTRSLEEKADGVVYGNRSAAYYKLGSFKEALNDGRQAVQLKPEYVKGYQRLAIAALAMNRLDDAEQASTQGLALCDPQDALYESLKELKDQCAEKQVKMKGGRPANTKSSDHEDGDQSPLYPLPNIDDQFIYLDKVSRPDIGILIPDGPFSWAFNGDADQLIQDFDSALPSTRVSHLKLPLLSVVVLGAKRSLEDLHEYKRMLIFLIMKGCRLDARDALGLTALAHCCYRPNIMMELAETLLERGADPNLQDRMGNYPLHLAVEADDVPCVKLLLRFNSKVDLTNLYDFTPAHTASGTYIFEREMDKQAGHVFPRQVNSIKITHLLGKAAKEQRGRGPGDTTASSKGDSGGGGRGKGKKQDQKWAAKQHQCAYCGRGGKMVVCSRCRKTRYCGPDCAEAHREAHESECVDASELRLQFASMPKFKASISLRDGSVRKTGPEKAYEADTVFDVKLQVPVGLWENPVPTTLPPGVDHIMLATNKDKSFMEGMSTARLDGLKVAKLIADQGVKPGPHQPGVKGYFKGFVREDEPTVLCILPEVLPPRPW